MASIDQAIGTQMNVDWIDLLLDAMSLKALFGTSLPSLNNVNLHEITLDRDGPRVLLRFDLDDFPKTPPKKWVDAGYTRVQLVIAAFVVHEVLISGWNTTNKVDMKVEKIGDLIAVSAKNDAVSFTIKAEFFNLRSVSGYAVNLSNPPNS